MTEKQEERGEKLDVANIESCERSLPLAEIVPDYMAASPIIRKYCWSRILTSLDAAEPLLRPGLELLDAGCGSGNLLKLLRERHPELSPGLSGLDYNPNAKALEAEGFKISTGDLRHMPYADASFDGLFCLDVLEHISDFEGAVDELRRVLRPGGFAVICQPMETPVYKFIKLLVKGQSGKVQYWKDKVLGAHHHDAAEIKAYVEKKFVVADEVRIPRFSPVKLSAIWVCRPR